MKFTYYTIIGKDVEMLRGHVKNIKTHAGFDKLACDKEFIVIIYTNPKINSKITDELIDICTENNITYYLYKEPDDNFLTNLYNCWNLGYEYSSPGFVFRAGSDQVFNKDSFPTLYDIAMDVCIKNPKIILQAQTIEHSVRAMRNQISRHLVANFGDHFDNLDLPAFEEYCDTINYGVKKNLLNINECVSIWGHPTPFYTSLGYINRTEGCSWLMTRKDWENYGPLPPITNGITGDAYIIDKLQLAGYKDFLVRDCITYHFFQGERMVRF